MGYRLSGDFDARSSDTFDPNLNVKVDESVTYGVTLDIPLSANWQFEILANRQRELFSVDRGLLSTDEQAGRRRPDGATTAGFLLQWGSGQVRRSSSPRRGSTHIEPKFNELDSDTRFSASLGGGVKVFFSQNIGMRFEARGFWTDLDTGLQRPLRPLRTRRRACTRARRARG